MPCSKLQVLPEEEARRTTQHPGKFGKMSRRAALQFNQQCEQPAIPPFYVHKRSRSHWGLSNLLHPWLHAERLLLLRAHHRDLTSTAVEPNTVARQLYSASACSSCAACCCGFCARSTGSCVQAAPASLGAAFALAYQVASAQTCSAAVKLQHPSLRESRMASKHRAHPWPEPSREVQLRSAYRYQTRRKRLSLSSSGVQPSSGPVPYLA